MKLQTKLDINAALQADYFQKEEVLDICFSILQIKLTFYVS